MGGIKIKDSGRDGKLHREKYLIKNHHRFMHTKEIADLS